jgi:acetolactate synthase regulatory subunit
MDGSVVLGLVESGGFQVLSADPVSVAANGDFTISASASGDRRWAIMYYPVSKLWQPVTVQTKPTEVSR